MKSFYVGLLVVWVVFSCTKEQNLSTLNGTWKLSAYQNVETRALETEPSNLNQSIEIHFSDNGLTGTISGHTVTNQVFGKYTLQPGYRLTIVEFGGTMVGEPEWGSRFWESFNQAGYYEAFKDRLFIYYNQNKEIMIFERK